MARNTIATAVVKGRGPFPLDMLRHDACYPKTQDDVSKIVESMGHPGHMMFVKLTHRILQHESATAFPCVERWNSFGWQVDKTERR